MSWLLNPEGDRKQPKPQPGPSKKPVEDEDPKVPDPSDSSRLISAKAANRPFLV